MKLIKTNYLIGFVLFSILTITIIFSFIIFTKNTNPYHLAVNENKRLLCLIKGRGLVEIHKNEIINHIYDGKNWISKEGNSNNCILVNK